MNDNHQQYLHCLSDYDGPDFNFTYSQPDDLKNLCMSMKNMLDKVLTEHNALANDLNCGPTKTAKLTKSLQRKLMQLQQDLKMSLLQSSDDTFCTDRTTPVSPPYPFLTESATPSPSSSSTTSSCTEVPTDNEWKRRIMRTMSSIVERICIDVLLLDTSNPTTKLWTEVRNRGCQFLGTKDRLDLLDVFDFKFGFLRF